MPRRPLRIVVPGVLITSLLATAATPALAANKSVSVGDNFFSPSRVAVLPGESVTWTTSGTFAHNVRFEDGLFTNPSGPTNGPWTASRTFASSGVYAYYCELHGGPGGQGMSGTVFVNVQGNVPPTAFFVFVPSPVQVGGLVSFNASSSVDADGTITKYEWDLDGNGSYETDTGATATTTQTYSTPGTRSIKLRVTDDANVTSETTKSLRVNAPPNASLATSPSSASTGSTVSFNGSGSSDPDGAITQYEWDLDGNGSFETNTGATSTTSRSYATPATVSVKLRVTDSDGATGVTSRSLQISRPVLSPLIAGSNPLPPSFAASKRSIKVSKTGRFSYGFGAEPGLSGTVGLKSVAKVTVSAKRRLTLGTKSFTVPSSGTVKVTWKLSRRNLKALRRNRRIKFRASVALRNAAGKASSGTATFTLKRPAR